MPPRPSSVGPWQSWHSPSPRFAEYAWKPRSAVCIHGTAWPSADFFPHGWHASQVKPRAA